MTVRANIRHLLIPVGNDWSETLTFYEQVAIACTAAASATAATLKVKPLGIQIPSGTVLRYGACYTLTTTATANAGAEAVSVASVPVQLSVGTELRAIAEDLTNCTAEARIWKADLTAPTATPATPFIFTPTVISPATNGQWLLNLTDTETASLVPNCVWSDLPSDLQSESAFSPNVWRSRYYWQFNVTNTVTGTRTRRIEGAVFASKEKL